MADIEIQAASWPIASAIRQDGNASSPAGIAKMPRARRPGCTSTMRSTNENAAKCSSERPSTAAISITFDSRSRCRLVLGADDQLAESLGREKAWNVGDLHRGLEA